MTTKTHRTEIQIETHEIKIIRSRGQQHSAYCERCMSVVHTAEHSSELPEEPGDNVRSVEEKNLDSHTSY